MATPHDGSPVGSPDTAADQAFVDPAAGDRVFGTTRPVGLSEVDRHGALRLDGLASYVQDIAAQDSDDAALGDTWGWVVRNFACRVAQWPVLGEQVELRTFCGGTGRAWAQRRTTVQGRGGGSVEVAAMWICVDAGGRPVALPARFAEIWGAATRRRVSARATHVGPPPGAESGPWALRRADEDALGHVNNAAHWRAVVELIGDREVGEAEMEFRSPLLLSASGVALRWLGVGRELSVWLTSDDGLHSSARVRFGLADQR